MKAVAVWCEVVQQGCILGHGFQPQTHASSGMFDEYG